MRPNYDSSREDASGFRDPADQTLQLLARFANCKEAGYNSYLVGLGI